VVLAAISGCGARTALRDGSAGSDSPSDGDGDGDGDGDDGCADGAGGMPSVGQPPPLLYFAFEGDARNLGTLGAAYDGIVHSGWFDAGIAGRAVVTQLPAFIELPGSAAPLSAAAALTIAFWFMEDGAAALNTAMLDCRSGDDGFHVYRGVYDDYLSLCWGAGDPSLGPGGCGPFPLEAGGWHHLLVERSGEAGDVEVWLDAARVVTLPASGHDVFGETTNDIFLGAPHVGELNGSGRLRFDELRVYDRVLDETQRCSELGGAWCDDCPE